MMLENFISMTQLKQPKENTRDNRVTVREKDDYLSRGKGMMVHYGDKGRFSPILTTCMTAFSPRN